MGRPFADGFLFSDCKRFTMVRLTRFVNETNSVRNSNVVGSIYLLPYSIAIPFLDHFALSHWGVSPFFVLFCLFVI